MGQQVQGILAVIAGMPDELIEHFGW
jgi:hypothetical protein